MDILIGDKIKLMRLKHGLTQKELADRCELSKGFISLVESDQTIPSLTTLADILEVLGTTFEEFFATSKSNIIVYKKENMFEKEMENGGMITWLVSNAQEKTMEPIIIELPKGEESEIDMPHTGEEFGYVLKGGITLFVGSERQKLKKGDAFYFKADKKHYIKNHGKLDAAVLWVSSPPTF